MTLMHSTIRCDTGDRFSIFFVQLSNINKDMNKCNGRINGFSERLNDDFPDRNSSFKTEMKQLNNNVDGMNQKSNCVFNVWTLVVTGSGAGSVILDFAGLWVWGHGPRSMVPGLLGGRSWEWTLAVVMFTYRNLMHVLCLLITLLAFVITLHRTQTGNDFINQTDQRQWICICKHVWGAGS